jgi:hypothetical protein
MRRNFVFHKLFSGIPEQEEDRALEANPVQVMKSGLIFLLVISWCLFKIEQIALFDNWLQSLAIDHGIFISLLSNETNLDLAVWLYLKLTVIQLDAYSSQSDLWSGISPLSTNKDWTLGQLGKIIVLLTAKCGVLIQVGEVRILFVSQHKLHLLLFLLSAFALFLFAILSKLLFPWFLDFGKLLLGLLHLIYDILSVSKSKLVKVDDATVFGRFHKNFL